MADFAALLPDRDSGQADLVKLWGYYSIEWGSCQIIGLGVELVCALTAIGADSGAHFKEVADGQLDEFSECIGRTCGDIHGRPDCLGCR